MNERGSPSGADANRGRLYTLLARLTMRAPDAPLLQLLSAIDGDASEIGRCVAALSAAARATSEREAEREFNRLFIGVARGEVMPYASFYLTGFLYGEPLLEARRQMARLGIERAPSVSEPEDHAGTLMEAMAALIDGRISGGSIDAQREFFEAHIEPWLPRFFRDLEAAPSADLYKPVARLGRCFLHIEAEAFALADA